nr:LuxR C-terminal-related transcriptional regulator [Agromyces luteolus]
MTTLAVGSRGRSHFLSGDLDEAETWMSRSLETEGIAYPPFRVGMLGSSALLRIWNGRAAEAELLAAEAIDAASAGALLDHPVIADAYLARALVDVERGAPAVAAVHLRAGIVRAEANRRSQLLWLGRYVHGVIAAAEGRFDDALAAADLARSGDRSAEGRNPGAGPAPAILDRLRALHLSVLRRSGRADEALRRSADPTPVGPAVAFEAIAAALAVGDPGAARRMLDRDLDRPGPASDSPLSDIRRSILLGWLAEISGSHAAAVDHLAEALGRAEPHGLVAVFLEAGPTVLDLACGLTPLHGGVAADLARRRDGSSTPGANAELAEPLTTRELEILAFLPDHSTNAELAKQCFVSVNTLKTHTAHIYRKLGVSGRSAAIARARELGLLDPVSRPDRARA